MDLVTVKRIIAAPIGEVWAVTSSFGAIRAWMPAAKSCSVEGAGLGATRTVLLANGATAHERLDEVDPLHHRVRYAILTPGTTNAKGLVGGTELRAIGATATEVTWTLTADSLEGDLDRARAGLTQMIVGSLDGLGKLLNADVREA